MPPGDAATVRVAVGDLVAAYCDAVTRADSADFGACWSAGATWVIPGTGEVQGRDAIVEQFARTRAAYDLCVQELLSGRVRVAPDGCTAQSRWYVRELQHSPDRTGGELIGAYDDDCALEADGAWRFTRRAFNLLYRGRVEMPGRVYRLPPRWSGAGSAIDEAVD
jgi:ketosteroid isomerase-like protein